jgi:hypothetical protein
MPLTINKYAGEWSYRQAVHLLRRSIFGPTHQQIKESVSLGMDETIKKLLLPPKELTLPINYFFTNDPEVPVGETWVGKKMDTTVSGLVGARNSSLSAWIINMMMEKEMNIADKMTLFWHNHLVISDIFNPSSKYTYFLLLRKYILGDFRQLMKEMTISPGMLEYLNGNENTASAPNENYGRELLELFTIGKGPISAPNDYTNYTETDIREFSRSLSGWTIDRNLNIGVYKKSRHDPGQKQLSHRFDNVVINNLEAEEYKKVIDIIFEKEEVAKFICRQLYIWFVNYQIDENIENDVISPLAEIFIQNEYNISPVLKALLSSNIFYDDCNMGTMIKSPVDFSLTLLKAGQFPKAQNLIQEYTASNYLNQNVFKKMDQAYFFVPSVAGWKAYYQEPVYYKYWLSSVSLPQRKNLANSLILGTVKIGDKKYGLDFLSLIAQFDEPSDPNKMIKSLTDLFLCNDLSTEQFDYLKTTVLLAGNGDYVWTKEYNDYLANPTDTVLKNTVNKRLQNLCSILFNLPEHHLM